MSKNGKTKNDIKVIERTLKLIVKREREKSRDALELSRRCSAHAQHASRTLSVFRRLAASSHFSSCALVCAVVITCASITGAHADDRRCKRDRDDDNKNYILRRQEAYQVQGVPTSRLIIGKREIDFYRDGKAFEKDNRLR
jgi:hypothetical protein